MSTNNVQAKKPSINQQITDAQNARNKYLAVAMCALVGSALAAGGAGYLGLVASGMMGASVVVLIGPQAVIACAALAAVVALVLVAVASCCVLGAIINQNKAADAELELFTPWYRDPKKIEAAKMTPNLNHQIAIDVSRDMTILNSDDGTIFIAMPGETIEDIEARVEANLRQKFCFNLLDQCHQGAMADATNFVKIATGYPVLAQGALSPQIENANIVRVQQQPAVEVGPEEEQRGLKCDISFTADINNNHKYTHIATKEKDVLICDVALETRLDGTLIDAEINMKTTADRLTKLWAQSYSTIGC